MVWFDRHGRVRDGVDAPAALAHCRERRRELGELASRVANPRARVNIERAIPPCDAPTVGSLNGR